METIDTQYITLRSVGYTGGLEEMLRDYYNFLGSTTYTAFKDAQYYYMRSLTYTGALEDMLYTHNSVFTGTNIVSTFDSSDWTNLSNTTLSDQSDGAIRATTSVAGSTGFNKVPLVSANTTYLMQFYAKSNTTQSAGFLSIGDTSDTGDFPINPILTSIYQRYEFRVTPTSTAFRVYATLDSNGDSFDINGMNLREVQ